ncbi:MAG: Gfo/Idh/MocA family oxidoreductase, partial [Chloroflexi bacterium]|nr:Gfo/Idh/MocA family oxidoreductase [Chloroflexota bacterium]
RRVAAAGDGVFQVGFNRRFAPAYVRAKELVANGEIVPASLAVKMNRGELRQPAWVANAEITGGFLYESTIHLLDLIRWLAGEVRTVYARARASVYPPQLDDFAVTFETSAPPVPAAIAGQRDCGIAGGGRRAVIGTLVSSAHAGWLFPFERIELFGEHATVVTEEMDAITASPGLELASVTTRYAQLPTVERWGYAGETRCFLGRMQGRQVEAPDAEDGYRAVELAEAIYRSAASRSEVGLPLVLE